MSLPVHGRADTFHQHLRVPCHLPSAQRCLHRFHLAVSGSSPLWGYAFSPLVAGPDRCLDFWGAAKPRALQQGGWDSVGHMEMFGGPGDDDFYVERGKKGARADALKLDLISGKSLLKNGDDSISIKEAQTFSVFDAVPDAVPKAEQRDWKQRKNILIILSCSCELPCCRLWTE